VVGFGRAEASYHAASNTWLAHGAPIVNGVTVVIKAAEMAVKLKRLGVSVASRIPQSGFALPSAQTLDEFLRHG
jgi:hypothetical protein